jgi:hypothetical protein
MRGIEFNYSQQLSFLPGVLRGLGLLANWTWVQYPGRVEAGALIPATNVIPRTGNAGLTYSFGRWEARLLWSYKAAALTAYVPAAPLLRNTYRAERSYWDFNGSVKLTRLVRLFTSLSNITSEPQLAYAGYIAPQRNFGSQGLSFLITAGVKITP